MEARPVVSALARRTTALVAALLVSAPALALACPYCAGRSANPVAGGIILGAFVFFPFLVVYVVVRKIRRGEQE